MPETDGIRTLLFLDVDGVLNGCGSGPSTREGLERLFEPRCCANFQRIVDATHPRVVLSSSWRNMIHHGDMSVRGFETLLRTHGVRCDLVCLTRRSLTRWSPDGPHPESAVTRAGEVRDWLDLDGSTGPFVVLDDDDDGFRAAGMPLVQTIGSLGLTDVDAELAISLIRQQQEVARA